MADPYKPPKETDREEERKIRWPLVLGAVFFAALALMVGGFFLWAVSYWASNTPFMGRFATPPVPSAKLIGGLACASIPLGFLALLISFVFAREAFRRD